MLSQSSETIPFLDETNFAQEALDSELPVVVTFRAEWSSASKQLEKTLHVVARQLSGKAKFFLVDVDRSQMLAAQLRVQSVPATVVFVGGRLGDAKAGLLSKDQIISMVEPFLPKAQGALPPREAAELQKQGRIVFVDTRDEASYKRTHLPGAVHVPLDQLPNRLAELHMLGGTPVLYCRSGKESQQMSEKLAQQGMAFPYLEGGILAWEIEGLPIERA